MIATWSRTALHSQQASVGSCAHSEDPSTSARGNGGMCDMVCQRSSMGQRCPFDVPPVGQQVCCWPQAQV